MGSIAWPAIPDARAAQRLAILQQIETTQWLPSQDIQRRQFVQLNRLLRHAFDTIPFYRHRLLDAGLGMDRGVGPEDWLRLPPLTRADIQQAGEALVSTAIPPSHSPLNKASTSGSTGMPVTVTGTAVTKLFWEVLTLREHLWQDRDLGGTMAAIRRIPDNLADYPKGVTRQQWGPPVAAVFDSGPIHGLAIESSLSQQAEWLQRVDPHYLRGYPTNLNALAQYCADQGVKLPNLKQCISFGELLHPEVRETCRAVWDVGIADTYSSQEVGYLSLQAPGFEHQLVQSDFVLVEVLDRVGQPCGPGQFGRVVVTSLHNFAMPLLRYEIGDFAEVGGPCPTGRGLPVLNRIMGRERNMLVDPEGNQYWPAFGVKALVKIAPVKQFQLAQIGAAKVEMRIVTARPLSEEEKAAICDHLGQRLPGGLAVEVRELEEIARSPSGKYEDFVNETLR